MELNLKRPIVFLDLETTGTNVGADRIVEIGLLKIFPNGSKDSRTYKVNPTIPIPEETSKILAHTKRANSSFYSITCKSFLLV